MNYIVSLFPICLYLLFIKGMDGFSLSQHRRTARGFGWGAISCGLCLLWGMLIGFDTGNGFPIVEELIKGLPLIITVHRKRSAFFIETLNYGAAVGAGFAVLENIIYVTWNPQFTLGDAILRGVGTSLLHIGCSALIATNALVCYRLASRYKKTVVKIALTFAGLIPSIAVHFIYNLFLLPEFIQMILTVSVFIGLFVLTYKLDEHLIHRWLDLCITNDIALYNSIRQGRLSTTNAGKYLLQVKERFAPEVFFDICVFLGLYLELTIAAKSRMIMHEAGMNVMPSTEQKNVYSAKLAELKSLRRGIGTAGMMILMPLVGLRDTDFRIMEAMK